MNKDQTISEIMERKREDLLRQIDIEYPSMTSEELDRLKLRCDGYASSGVSFITNSNHKITVDLGIGKKFGKVVFRDLSDKGNFDEKILLNTAIRIFKDTNPAGIILVYNYMKHMQAKLQHKEEQLPK